jgi:hypothetical protein
VPNVVRLGGKFNDDGASGCASTKKHPPRKILRYFPVIPRLERLIYDGEHNITDAMA